MVYNIFLSSTVNGRQENEKQIKLNYLQNSFINYIYTYLTYPLIFTLNVKIKFKYLINNLFCLMLLVTFFGKLWPVRGHPI